MRVRVIPVIVAIVLVTGVGLSAQTAEPEAPAQTAARDDSSSSAVATTAAIPTTSYVIGPDDVLAVAFWREPDMSADVVVRPDGKISLPLLHDVQAAGLTPEELRQNLVDAAGSLLEDPNASVVVKEINSRQVFITGQVATPGAYSLTSQMTVLQLIAMAGGLTEFADQEDIVLLRTENRRRQAYGVNYKDLLKGENLWQNAELKPGDTVAVP